MSQAVSTATPATIPHRRQPLVLAPSPVDLMALFELPAEPEWKSPITVLAGLESSLDPAGLEDLGMLVASWCSYDKRQKDFRRVIMRFFEFHPQFIAGRPLLYGPRFLAQARDILNDPDIISAWNKLDASPPEVGALPKLVTRYIELTNLMKAAKEHWELLEIFAGLHEIPMSNSLKLWDCLVRYHAAGVGRGLPQG